MASVDDLVKNINECIGTSTSLNVAKLIEAIKTDKMTMERFIGRNFRVFKKLSVFEDELDQSKFLAHLKKVRVNDPIWNELQLAVLITENVAPAEAKDKKLVRRLVKAIDSYTDEDSDTDEEKQVVAQAASGSNNVLNDMIGEITSSLQTRDKIDVSDIINMAVEMSGKYKSKLETIDPSQMLGDLQSMISTTTGGQGPDISALMQSASSMLSGGAPGGMPNLAGIMSSITGGGAANPVGGLLGSLLGSATTASSQALTPEQQAEMEEFYSKMKL